MYSCSFVSIAFAGNNAVEVPNIETNIEIQFPTVRTDITIQEPSVKAPEDSKAGEMEKSEGAVDGTEFEWSHYKYVSDLTSKVTAWRATAKSVQHWTEIYRQAVVNGTNVSDLPEELLTRSSRQQNIYNPHMGSGYGLFGSAVRGIGDLFLPDDSIVSAGLDTWDSIDRGIEVGQHYGEFSRWLKSGESFVGNSTQLVGNLSKASKILGQVNVGLSAVGMAVDGYDAYTKFADGDNVGGWQSTGSALMAGSVAIGAAAALVGVAAAPVTLVVAGVGLGIWAGATIYKHKEKVWKAIKNPKKAWNNAKNDVKKAANNAADTVKGWFS
ncbi:hypothetical protein [Mechercharimyces sp. CAU 1602]|uniref:hypothetical protein n=1 Tax=Mechercharimyces sp. CAU 1602 TaxID=2973933 RepID=UPI0021626112|nr:hypothetical protein [Mechercharimyces sp. CAU 1602]MCS1352440.1 hypothetical protein [Mechercharimyces sp. CAU 1602]